MAGAQNIVEKEKAVTTDGPQRYMERQAMLRLLGPRTYIEGKAREIILVAFYHWGHRLFTSYIDKPLCDIYNFYHFRYPHTTLYFGSSDYSFLDIFHPDNTKNKYGRLLYLDSEGKIPCRHVKEVPKLTVGEALECVDELQEQGWVPVTKALSRLLKLDDAKGYCGDKSMELAAAAMAVYS